MPVVKNKFIDQVIREIEHLPTLPQVVMRVLAMAESPNINAVELSKAMDQSLAAKVLKVANSAYYGSRLYKSINTIPHAIVIIGFDAVKEIILTASFFHTFHDAQDVQVLQPLWQHSLECAQIAKRLAWIFRYSALDEAYLTGLVHDVGKLIIQQYFPDQYQLIENKKENGIKDLEAEMQVLDITHAEIGGKMSERWAFPDPLVDAITHHHDKSWKINLKLGRILHYADRYVLGTIGFSELLKSFEQAGMHHPATWVPSDLEEVETILRGEIEKARNMFNFADGLKEADK